MQPPNNTTPRVELRQNNSCVHHLTSGVVSEFKHEHFRNYDCSYSGPFGHSTSFPQNQTPNKNNDHAGGPNPMSLCVQSLVLSQFLCSQPHLRSSSNPRSFSRVFHHTPGIANKDLASQGASGTKPWATASEVTGAEWEVCERKPGVSFCDGGAH